MGRLFRAPPAEADARPALMSVISLMVLLLPMLVATTSAQRLAGLPLGVPGPADELPPESPGPVEDVTVRAEGGGYRLEARVRRADVRASAGEVELRSWALADLPALQAALADLKRRDPARDRITLIPSPTTTTAELVRWMDGVRHGPDGVLYPKVVLQPAGAGP